MGSSNPFVSVLVPVFNGGATIRDLIAALRSQRYPQESFEVLIVDDASTDDTLEQLRAQDSGFTIIESDRNRGSYAARNLGLRRSRGELIAFTDADCVPDPEWLRAGIAALQAQAGGVVAGAVRITPHDAGSAVQCYDEAFGIQQAYFATKLKFGATANLLAFRSALEMTGGFDDRLRSGGDRKFCETSRALGLPFSYCRASVVRHAPRTTLRQLAAKQIRISIGQAYIFPKWSRCHIFPLGRRDPLTLDHRAFAARDPWFKLRFWMIYYFLEYLHFLIYSWASWRRRDPDP